MPGTLIPSPNDVHVNQLLNNVLVAFPQQEDAFVAHRAFRTIPVDHQTDIYPVYPIDEWARDDHPVSAPATEAETAEYTIDKSNTYSCQVRRLAHDIPDERRANADGVFNQDSAATKLLARRAMIRRDRHFAATFMSGGVWTHNVSGVAGTPGANQFTFWNDPASTPIEDVRLGKQTVQSKTGYRPNVMILGRQVFDKLLDHPDIVGRFDRGQTTGPAIATRQTLAALFELDEVLVMDGVYNAAAKGAAKAMDFIGGKTALLEYRPAGSLIEEPAAGYIFGWSAMVGSDPVMGRMLKFRMDTRSADRVQHEMAWDMKLIAADLGYSFNNAVQ